MTDEHPSLSAGDVSDAVNTAVSAAAGFHALLFVVCVSLVFGLASGRSWVRRVATVSQLASVVFSVVSWSSSPMFHAVIPVVSVAQIAVALLLWWPDVSRRFFATR